MNDWNGGMKLKMGMSSLLQDSNLLLAPLFIDLARAFLSIQVSSASVERIFGDAGYQEGNRRQKVEDSVTEMQLTIRSFVKSRIDSEKHQKEFLTSASYNEPC